MQYKNISNTFAGEYFNVNIDMPQKATNENQIQIKIEEPKTEQYSFVSDFFYNYSEDEQKENLQQHTEKHIDLSNFFDLKEYEQQQEEMRELANSLYIDLKTKNIFLLNQDGNIEKYIDDNIILINNSKTNSIDFFDKDLNQDVTFLTNLKGEAIACQDNKLLKKYTLDEVKNILIREKNYFKKAYEMTLDDFVDLTHFANYDNTDTFAFQYVIVDADNKFYKLENNIKVPVEAEVYDQLLEKGFDFSEKRNTHSNDIIYYKVLSEPTKEANKIKEVVEEALKSNIPTEVCSLNSILTQHNFLNNNFNIKKNALYCYANIIQSKRVSHLSEILQAKSMQNFFNNQNSKFHIMQEDNNNIFSKSFIQECINKGFSLHSNNNKRALIFFENNNRKLNNDFINTINSNKQYRVFQGCELMLLAEKTKTKFDPQTTFLLNAIAKAFEEQFLLKDFLQQTDIYNCIKNIAELDRLNKPEFRLFEPKKNNHNTSIALKLLEYVTLMPESDKKITPLQFYTMIAAITKNLNIVTDISERINIKNKLYDIIKSSNLLLTPRSEKEQKIFVQFANLICENFANSGFYEKERQIYTLLFNHLNNINTNYNVNRNIKQNRLSSFDDLNSYFQAYKNNAIEVIDTEGNVYHSLEVKDNCIINGSFVTFESQILVDKNTNEIALFQNTELIPSNIKIGYPTILNMQNENVKNNVMKNLTLNNYCTLTQFYNKDNNIEACLINPFQENSLIYNVVYDPKKEEIIQIVAENKTFEFETLFGKMLNAKDSFKNALDVDLLNLISSKNNKNTHKISKNILGVVSTTDHLHLLTSINNANNYNSNLNINLKFLSHRFNSEQNIQKLKNILTNDEAAIPQDIKTVSLVMRKMTANMSLDNFNKNDFLTRLATSLVRSDGFLSSVNYNNLQHSINVFKLVKHRLETNEAYKDYTDAEKKDIMTQALFHDSIESILSDIPTPIKNKIPEIYQEEKKLLEKCFNKIGLGRIYEHSLVSQCDGAERTTFMQLHLRNHQVLKDSLEIYADHFAKVNNIHFFDSNSRETLSHFILTDYLDFLENKKDLNEINSHCREFLKIFKLENKHNLITQEEYIQAELNMDLGYNKETLLREYVKIVNDDLGLNCLNANEVIDYFRAIENVSDKADIAKLPTRENEIYSPGEKGIVEKMLQDYDSQILNYEKDLQLARESLDVKSVYVQPHIKQITTRIKGMR